MNSARREFLLSIGTLISFSNNPPPVLAQSPQSHKKIQDALEKMLESGNYIRYLDTDLASISVNYFGTITEEDKAAFENLGGQIFNLFHEEGLGKLIGGLPKDSVREYSRKGNVRMISVQPPY